MLPSRIIRYIVLVCLLPFTSEAQTYYAVTALSGSQTINGNTVNIVQIGAPTSGILCGVTPYYVQTGGYRYVFTSPVYRIRAHFVAINADDTVKMKINGSHFNIANTNLTNFTACSSGPMNAFIVNGNIVGIGTGNNGVQFDTYMPAGIDSVEIDQENSGSGWIYDFYFAGDCPGSVTTSANQDSLCAGNSLSLTATGTSLSSSVTYSWTGPSGSTFNSSIQNPGISNVSSSDSGIYTVTANDTGGCSYISSLTVSVLPSISAFAVSSNGPVCIADTLHLFSTGINIASYNWTGPASFSMNTQNPSKAPFTYNDTGYFVCTATNFCSSVTDSVHVTSNNPDVTIVNYSNPACTNQTLYLSASSNTSGVTYLWHGPNFTDPNQNTTRPNVTLSDSGYYKVAATANGCSSYDSVLIHVLPTPAVPTVGSNSPVCAGSNLNLTASTTTSGVTYSWSGPSGFSQSVQNPTIFNVSANNLGLYTVVVRLNGCADSASTSVVVNPMLGPPGISINANPGISLCAGSIATFNAVPTNAGLAAYQWKVNGTDIAGATNSSYSSTTLNNGDIVTCKVTGNLPCQSVDTGISNALHMNIISLSPPSVTLNVFTSGNTTTFSGVVTGNIPGLRYQWMKNGVFIPNQNNIIYSPSTSSLNVNDTICIIVYDTVACTFPDSSIACYTVTTGVKNVISSFDNVNIYPNPISNQLIIDGAEKGDKVVLLNIIGQEIYKGRVNDKKEIIDTHNLTSGNYLLEIIDSQGEKLVRKITK